jgi:hypothetical protein
MLKEDQNLSKELFSGLDRILLGMVLPNIFDERIPNLESYNLFFLITYFDLLTVVAFS